VVNEEDLNFEGTLNWYAKLHARNGDPEQLDPYFVKKAQGHHV